MKSAAKSGFWIRFKRNLMMQTLGACVIFAGLWGLFHVQNPSPWLQAAQQAVRGCFVDHYDAQSVIQLIRDVGLWGDSLEYETLSQFSLPASGQIMESETGANPPEAVIILTEDGAAVRAVAEGKISAAGEDPVLGLWLELRTVDGMTAKYGFCKEVFVRQGDPVEKGQVIARTGQTGDAESPRLYFLLTKGDQFVDVNMAIEFGN
jgi:murein DD-endopeptidase MepM/ murein hydrolase activator NlpD